MTHVGPMSEIQHHHYPQNKHSEYHAHVYFDEQSVRFAESLRDKAIKELALTVGRFHTKNVGPHTRWSFQILFSQKDFDHTIAWLESNRHLLTVFIHGVTGDDLLDHTEYAYWLGDAVPLELSLFRK